MPKPVKHTQLTSRTSRLRLASRPKPYWMLLSDGLHLGYRRPETDRRAGAWVARRYVGGERYETVGLGTADDYPEMPGVVDVLTFDEAQAKARTWADTKSKSERASTNAKAHPTVRQIVEAYVERRTAISKRCGHDAGLRLRHHVLGCKIADIRIAALTEDDVAEWRASIRRGGRRNRDKPFAPATVARLLNDFRAALAPAVVKLPEVAAMLRVGLRAPEDPDRARDRQVLADADVRRIIEAAFDIDPDLGAMVMVLAATGARFSQIARLTVADLQIGNARLMVPASAKGRSRKAKPSIAVPLPEDVVAQLRPLVAGRRGHEPLLMRWHHQQVEGDRSAGRLPEWKRDGRRAWATSSEMTRSWKDILSAAQLPAEFVPYSLRHSSIVRGLRAGLPVRLVAAVHDTSVAMIEKHYSAFVVDASEDLLRRAAVPLAPAIPSPIRVVSGQ
jgi:integrase